MKKIRFILIIFFIPVFLLFLFGCTRTFHIEVCETGCPEPVAKLLPLNVAVYYGDEFRTFKTIERVFGGRTNYVDHIQIGKANIALFNYILSHVFEKVTVIDKPDEGSKGCESADLVIVPELFYFFAHATTESDRYVSIVYAVSFFSSDGELMNVWKIAGTGEGVPRLEFKNETTAVVELTQMAMRQVAAQFITGFCEQEMSEQFFNKQCNE